MSLPTSPKMIEKKARLSRLMKMAAQIAQGDQLSRSLSLRKAWVMETQPGRYQWMPNLIDSTLLDVAGHGGVIGGVKLLQEGFVSGRNRNNQAQIFRCRKEALNFALSREKIVVVVGQLPLM